MHELPLETAIWNRACAGDAASFLPGDRALSNILMEHGFVMNGGVLHAVECLSDVQFADALAGYRFYDLHSAAAVMIRAKEVLDDEEEDPEIHEDSLDLDYVAAIPDEDFFSSTFLDHLRRNPSAYAPV